MILQRAPTSQALGAYLLEQGEIAAPQLEEALALQRDRQGSDASVRLGEILLERGWVSPQALARALLLQQQDHHGLASDQPPLRLGEYLVAEGIITPEQLETAFADQARHYQRGQRIPLGTILVHGGDLTDDALERVLIWQNEDRAAYSEELCLKRET